MNLGRTIKETGKKGYALLKKHLPFILTTVGTVGAIITGIEIAKAAPKVKEDISEFKEKREVLSTETEEGKKEVILLYKETGLKVLNHTYKPIVIGVFSVSSIYVSHGMLMKQIGALGATLSSVSQSFNEYRSNVEKTYGPEVDQQMRYNIVKDVATDESGKSVDTITHKQPEDITPVFTVLFQQDNPLWRKDRRYNLDLLYNIEKTLNARLKSEGVLMLNDVCYETGLKKNQEGCFWYWVWDPNDPTKQDTIDLGIKELLAEQPDRFGQINLEPVIMMKFNCHRVLPRSGRDTNDSLYYLLPPFEAV